MYTLNPTYKPFIIFIFACISLGAQAKIHIELPWDPQPWSDSLSWPNETLPDSGATVTIPKGTTIVLDIAPPPLRELIIEGKLQFLDKDLALTASSISLRGGTLQIGTENELFKSKANITLTHRYEDSTLLNPQCIVISDGGNLALHGASVEKKSWTQLTNIINSGDTSLTIKSIQTNWQVGDSLVIATSTFNSKEAEKIRINSISDDRITFSPAVKFFHDGKVERWGRDKWDKRTEIALLTRNILIKGDEDAAKEKKGACVIIKPDAGMIQMQGVELFMVGQAGLPGKYPIFWQGGSIYQNGQFINHCTIRNSFHRAITIDGTNQLTVSGNVAYNIFNHAYVISENGVGTRNSLRDNIAIDIRRPDAKEFAFPGGEWQLSLRNEDCPTGYYIGNPYQILQNNSVAGCEYGIGIWYVNSLNGIERDSFTTLIFEGNITHGSSLHPGLKDKIFPPALHGIGLRVDASPLEGEKWVFRDFISYDNETAGLWSRSGATEFSDFILARNTIGCLPGQSLLSKGAIIGQNRSAIMDTSTLGQKIGVMVGFSGDSPRLTLRSINFYQINKYAIDIRHPIDESSSVKDLHFYQCQIPFHYGDNSQFLSLTDWDNSIINGQAFIVGQRSNDKTQRPSKVSSQQASLILSNNHHLITDSCQFKKDWNTYICPGSNYVEMSIATGKAGSAPVLAHDIALKQVSLVDTVQMKEIYLQKLSEQASGATVPSNQKFDLSWNEQQMNVPDIRFDVKGKPYSWVMLEVPYSYSVPYVFRLYGSLIQQTNHLDSLYSATTSSWFRQDSNSKIILKLVMDSTGREEIILFSETYKTMISSGTDPIYITVKPVQLTAEEASLDSAFFGYNLSQDSEICLSISDAYGEESVNIIDEKQDSGYHTIKVAKSDLPTDHTYLIYQLKVDNQLHKGPLLIEKSKDSLFAEETTNEN